MDRIITALYKTPCGTLELASFGDSLVLCDWVSGAHHARTVARAARMLDATTEPGTSDVIRAAKKQLDEYFVKRRIAFDLPLAFTGTDFQKAVWSEIAKIEYGDLMTYGDLARTAGRPGAVRATGLAVGANPLSVIVPCHRIVGKDGAITGYGGGIEAKKWLLRHEGHEESDALTVRL